MDIAKFETFKNFTILNKALLFLMKLNKTAVQSVAKSFIILDLGDDRVNENVGLVSTHLIFTREHNRIARRLKSLNPMWDGDKVFEEARRILIAEHQMITYK